MSTEEKFADIDKRLQYQEQLHRKINPQTNSFVHWDNTAYLITLVSVIVSVAATMLIIKMHVNK